MKISDLIRTGPRETARQRLDEFLRYANDTRSDYPRNATVAGVFQEQALRAPEALAIAHAGSRFTYRELADWANGIAAELLQTGLHPEDAVGLLAVPGAAAIAGMLGTLRAGGAYVPLPADGPLERIALQVRDCGTHVLVTDAGGERLAREVQARCPSVHHVLVARPGLSGARQLTPDAGRTDGLAYIMYTSGTEGAPKGVMIEQRGILRLVLHANWITLCAADRILLTGSLAFDASTFEIWGALLHGAALIIPERDQLLDPSELARLIRLHGVSVMWLTSSFFNTLAANHAGLFDGLRTVISGGERVSAHHFRLLRQSWPQLQLKNGYGPTENTTFTTVHDFADEPGDDVPIGRPVSNTTVHILDERQEPVLVGIHGELWTGGEGLARGYLNDPELTRQRFVNHPQFGRIYRTGDLARWRADGVVQYLGRRDDQIKIRGHRVEPGEIEACLLGFPGIKECAVLSGEDGAGGVRLIAWVTASRGVNLAKARQFAADRLPEYMVPARVEELPALPRTPQGKLDRQALPAPRESAPLGEAQSPSNHTEREVTAIWEDVLQRSPISLDDDFFALGGNSLSAVRLIGLLQQRLAFSLPFSLLLKAPTVRAMARRLLDEARFGNTQFDDALICLTPERDAPAVFAFPPGTGDALSYVQLARRLTGYRVYAFNFIPGGDLLANWAKLIAAEVPNEPYRLLGYSGGGNLAHRTAAALEAQGRRVSIVAMLDSSRFLRRYRFPAGESRRLASEFLAAAEVARHAPTGVLQDKVIRTIDEYYDFLSGAADTTLIDAPIALIRGADDTDEFHDADGELVCSKSAWAAVTRSGLHSRPGAGEHGQMLSQAFLDRNATLLRQALDGD